MNPDLDHSAYLKASVFLANSLRKQAHWNSDQCTWLVRRSSPAREDDGTRVQAGGTVYSGTAGIGLALAYVASCSGERCIEECALAALRHAFAAGAAMSADCIGFHDGLTGIAYALAVASDLLNCEELGAYARQTIARIRPPNTARRGGDVITGEAGAIPALLLLEARYKIEGTRAMAIKFGNELIASAARLPMGWAWHKMSYCRRPLTGLAHGASGYGLALFELARSTGEQVYRYGAYQAVAYERNVYMHSEQNWPDYRCNEMWRAMVPGGIENLRADVRYGNLPRHNVTSMMTAWCHGAPGIGLARVRAFEIDGERRLLAEARAAIDTTKRSLQYERANYSLCHGHAGNAEIVLRASQSSGMNVDVKVAIDRMTQLSDMLLRGDRPAHGTVGPLPDPTLMLGDAGFIYALAKMSKPQLPSVLLIEPSTSDGVAISQQADDDFRALRREDIKATGKYSFAGMTILDRERLESIIDTVDDMYMAPLEILDVIRSMDAGGRADEEASTSAYHLDIMSADLLGKVMDDVQVFLDHLASEDLTDAQFDTAHWTLSTTVRLLPNRSPNSPDIVLLKREGFAVRKIVLNEFAGRVLVAAQTGTTLTDLVAGLAQQLHIPQGEIHLRLQSAVETQLRNALNARLVVPSWPMLTRGKHDPQQ